MEKQKTFDNLSLLPQEEMLEMKQGFNKLNIGVPQETSFQENRISLTPESVSLLTSHGHQILLESNAGVKSNFSDDQYLKAGAKIVSSKKEVYSSDIIVKVEPPTESELNLLKKGQQLISAIQLKTRNKDYFLQLIKKHVLSIAIEHIRDNDGKLTLLRSMSEIAGNTSVLIASEYLSNVNAGKGLMLGGITGVSPTSIVVIGAGTVGEYASKTGIGLGANVKVFDTSLSRLRRLQEITHRNISTSIIHPKILEKAITRADVVIGALRSGDGRTPCVVSNEMVSMMKEGSVIVDVSIDQGGCFETSKVTTHKDPIFEKHGVIHYCVPNIPSRVSRTSSIAISNVIVPILINIGQRGGAYNLIKTDDGFRKGVYTLNGMMTNKTLSDMFDLQYKDLDLIISAL